MAPPLKKFRVQFIAQTGNPRSAVLGEGSIVAADIDAALWKTADLPPPTGARACRLTDLEGREVAYRFEAGPDGRPAMIVKFA